MEKELEEIKADFLHSYNGLKDDESIVSYPLNSRVMLLNEIINYLERKRGKIIKQTDLELKTKDILSKQDFDEALDHLFRGGDIFRPKKGYIEKIR